MDNGDAQQAAAAPAAAQGLQDQINYLQNQLMAQQNLFMQQQQYLVFQQQHMANQQAGRRNAEPSKMRLPPLWTQQAASWFQLAESQFNIYAVVEPRLRFNLVLGALSDEARLHAKAIIEAPAVYRDPYAALRDRILQVYQPSAWQMAAEFLQAKELGDRRPSDMMDEMFFSRLTITLLIKTVYQR